MTSQEIADKLGTTVQPLSDSNRAAIEAGDKWRSEMEAKIKAMPEPERTEQWERWQNRMAKWQD